MRVHSTRSTPSRAPSRALARRRTDVAVRHLSSLSLSLSRFLPTLSPASSRAPTDARDDENRETTTRETTPPPPRARLPPRVDAEPTPPRRRARRSGRIEHTECPNTHTHTQIPFARPSLRHRASPHRATSGGSVERARDDDDDSPRDRSLDAVDRSTDRSTDRRHRPTTPTTPTDGLDGRARARSIRSRFDSIRSIDRSDRSSIVDRRGIDRARTKESTSRLGRRRYDVDERTTTVRARRRDGGRERDDVREGGCGTG